MSAYDRLVAILGEYLGIHVRVFRRGAAARGLDLQSATPLLFKEGALLRDQKQLFKNLQVDLNLNELDDIEAVLNPLFGF